MDKKTIIYLVKMLTVIPLQKETWEIRIQFFNKRNGKLNLLAHGLTKVTNVENYVFLLPSSDLC